MVVNGVWDTFMMMMVESVIRLVNLSLHFIIHPTTSTTTTTSSFRNLQNIPMCFFTRSNPLDRYKSCPFFSCEKVSSRRNNKEAPGSQLFLERTQSQPRSDQLHWWWLLLTTNVNPIARLKALSPRQGSREPEFFMGQSLKLMSEEYGNGDNGDDGEQTAEMKSNCPSRSERVLLGGRSSLLCVIAGPADAREVLWFPVSSANRSTRLPAEERCRREFCRIPVSCDKEIVRALAGF
mmetsp:Transcript_15107/g.34877  ORF Transcript_15107/g.34877 Transcript_15107/m.34877 type:complete len:236 (-) Transcript_15107:28-735(-)